MTFSWKGVALVSVCAFCVTEIAQVNHDISCQVMKVIKSVDSSSSIFLSSTSSSSVRTSTSISTYEKYIPAPVEEYVIQHATELGYGEESSDPTGCNIWKNPQLTPFHNELKEFLGELKNYSSLLENFPDVNQDLRELLKQEGPDTVCPRLRLVPDGLESLFPSKQLSLTKSGYVEPLVPPMRHPSICYQVRKNLLRMDYMVHDFEAMCRSLSSHSRTVLIDMGASLDFHHGLQSPAMYAIQLYQKFGFYFDHIYAFEITPKAPQKVFEKVPPNLMASYHWNNVGVSADPSSPFNPLYSILNKFDEKDFVVVKLDIDTSFVEVPMAYQVLNDTSINSKIDQFYFEHHIHLKELARPWGSSMNGTIQQSLELFQGLRERGVAAHYWP